MNSDHADDNLLIVRAFVDPAAASAHMVGLDGDGGVWAVTTADGTSTQARVDWSSPVTERSGIRREVVVLYENACGKLGVPPRPH